MKAGEKFKISDDGTIYSLNNDGSISTLGKIVDGQIILDKSSFESELETNNKLRYYNHHEKEYIETKSETTFKPNVSKVQCSYSEKKNPTLSIENLLTKFYVAAQVSVNSFRRLGNISSVFDTSNFQFVDLGLDVLWATENFTTPLGKRLFSWKEAKEIENKVTTGRLPSISEIESLIKCCFWKPIKNYEKTIVSVEGPNGRSITFPLWGYQCNGNILRNGSGGHIWTSSLLRDKEAFALDFDIESIFGRFPKLDSKRISVLSHRLPKEWGLGLRLVKDK